MSGLRSFVEFSNAQEVLLIGSLWSGALRKAMSELGPHRRLHESTPLAQIVRDDRPRVIATVVAIGTRNGFLLARQDESASRRLLSEEWWELEEQVVSLFAYSCFSAEYFRTSELERYIEAALAYEDELWISVRDARFWAKFVRKIRKTLKLNGQIDDIAYTKVQKCYSKAVLGGLFRKPDYLTRICLMSQQQQLRLMQGASF